MNVQPYFHEEPLWVYELQPDGVIRKFKCNIYNIPNGNDENTWNYCKIPIEGLVKHRTYLDADKEGVLYRNRLWSSTELNDAEVIRLFENVIKDRIAKTKQILAQQEEKLQNLALKCY